MYDIGALYQAQSVPDAIALLQRHPEALVLAGGSDVLIQMREGKLAGRELVSIYTLDELRGVSLDPDGTLRILPLTSFSHIAKNPLVQRYIPVLGEAVDMVGGPQLRNIGTLGGNLCNGVTSADSASTLVAWDAELELTGPEGTRRLPLQEFYIGAGRVALQPAELLTAVLVPRGSYENCFGHYIKYAMRNAMDIATLGCSANVRLSADKKTIEQARLAYGVAAPVPIRSASAERAANGQPATHQTLQAAAKAALDDVNPRTSWRAARELRLHLVEELARRALGKAIELAGGTL